MDEMLPGQIISPRANQAETAQPPDALFAASRGAVVADSHLPASPSSTTPLPSSTTVPSQTQQSIPVAVSAQQEPEAVPAPVTPTSLGAQPAPLSKPSLPPQPPPKPYEADVFSQPEQSQRGQSGDQKSTLTWSLPGLPGQEKTARWYALYVAGLLLLSVGIYVLTRDAITTVIIFIALLGLMFLSLRKPKSQDFAVGEGDISIGRRVYYLEDFKAFSVLEEGAVVEVTLIPLKRFMPPISLYVQPDRAEDLVSHLSNYLPLEQHRSDAVDTILRRIRL